MVPIVPGRGNCEGEGEPLGNEGGGAEKQEREEKEVGIE